MKYSVIIPYRNREKHLELTLPRILEVFKGKEFEVIIAEQDDENKFRLSSLYDIAVKHATGDAFIFHDVDYYPTDDVVYQVDDQPTYPVRRVLFIGYDWKELPEEKVPAGYRHFKYDVGNHWGGVFIMTREQFEKINGFNPLYIGWGKEEEETRLRMHHAGYEPVRNTVGTFLALPHVDNGPDMSDKDFVQNHVLLSRVQENRHIGHRNIDADVEKFQLGDMKNVTWLKIKNWRLV